MLFCEHDSRRLTRTEHDGVVRVLMDGFQRNKLNALPTTIAVHSDGDVWFTDPGYGIISNYEGPKAAFELPANDSWPLANLSTRSTPTPKERKVLEALGNTENP